MMATPPPSSFKSFGPGHFKVVPGPGVELRVEPRGHVAVAYSVPVIMAALIAAVWLYPGVPFEVEVAFTVLASAAGAMLFTLFLWLHGRERRLGPHLVLTGEAVQLRGDRRVPLADFSSFEITRRWEPTGDSQTNVSYLVVKCKSGEEIAVLVSVIHRDVVHLKRTLDDRIGGLSSSARETSAG